MTEPTNDTAALEHFASVQPRAQTAGEFIEWLRDRRMFIGHLDRLGGFVPTTDSVDELLATWLDVDMAAVERARRDLLAAEIAKPSRPSTP